MSNAVRITEETIRALAAIAYFGEATPVQIRGRTGLQSGTLSPILARLEAAGWLESRTGEKPARQFYQIADAEAVCQMAQRVLGFLTQLAEDAG